ncbi:arabinan endo-1,5-alpha-L-arabinosidase [Sphingobacterium sp. LRF_L2]|uniref:arabinan endo-1,5-alpha-L-arabinosidase n=1 Tax=Sphingobacterium sp. LRF_L2 TaxID=3369421 RepID=UPI003F60FE31
MKKRTVGLGIVLILALSCKKDQTIDNDGTSPTDSTENGVSYTAPSYADDYAAISSWDNRVEWNLANVHDPTVVKAADGYYYMYSTDASYGNAHDGKGHFLYRRSKDLVHWEFKGMAMTASPAWLTDSLNNMRAVDALSAISAPALAFWAPSIKKVGSKYRMYYSVVVDNYIASGKANTADNFDNSWSEKAYIGLRETDYPANNLWIDKGMVVCSASDKGNDWYRSSLNNWNAYFKYNAIDPSYIVTPDNEHWLIYGSWHSGIVAIQLNPETGLPLKKFDRKDESTWGTPIYTRTKNSRWQGSEAPEIIYNAKTGYYYLFLAYDELSVAYNTRVARSKSVTGPYLGYDGKDISSGGEVYPILTHPYRFNNHAGWVGISHPAIFEDEATGSWYYASQGRLPANTNGNAYSNAIMMGHIRAIEWTSDGWPVVMPERYTALPQDVISENDLVGTWEYIALNYQYGVQQTATTLTLLSDKTATGSLSGNWNYNTNTQILTIGSQQLLLRRELDWESDPRTPTIVFAGLSATGVSIWGKKSK